MTTTACELLPLKWGTNECGNIVADGFDCCYLYDPEDFELHAYEPQWATYRGRFAKHLSEEAAKEMAWKHHVEAMRNKLADWIAVPSAETQEA